MKFYGAVAAEYLVRLRRHQAAGLPHPEAHRLASLETRQRRRAVLEVLDKAGADVDEPVGLSLLAAHGWEVGPAFAFPAEAEHERARPKPPPPADPSCGACRGTTFWVHRSGGPSVCSRCHPPHSPLVVERWSNPPGGGPAGGSAQGDDNGR